MKANHPRLLLRASTGVGICTAAIATRSGPAAATHAVQFNSEILARSFFEWIQVLGRAGSRLLSLLTALHTENTQVGDTTMPNHSADRFVRWISNNCRAYDHRLRTPWQPTTPPSVRFDPP